MPFTNRFTTTRAATAQRTKLVQISKTATAETWSNRPYSIITGNVELTIDIDAIVKALGAKALLSKRGVSRAMSGDVEVRVVKGTRKEKQVAAPTESAQ